jgi:putative ATP-dependent endonuclease of OLD family
MLYTLFNKRQFYESDFSNQENSIEIEFSLILDDVEVGLFDTLFNPLDSNKIDLSAKQEDPEEFIKLIHDNRTIDNNLKCINFVKYNSLRKPADELKFYGNRGVGKLLYYLIEKSLTLDKFNKDFYDKNVINDLVNEINQYLDKIRIFNEFDIKTSVEEDLIDLCRRMLVIYDSKDISIQRIGHGVQFSVLLVLDILNILMEINKKKNKKCIFENENGDKCVSLILGLDEPEIHLHPYRQRNLINYVQNLIKNDENEFSYLIKDLFDIDRITGQAIVITHSPYVISNDYRTISRFYKKNGNLTVTSGLNLNLDDDIRKHLLKNLPYVKEALFSRCNILVEGDSEVGAFPEFFNKLGTYSDLDELGISIINAGGADAIPPVAKLLNHFGIQNIGIVDKDKFPSLVSKGKIEPDMNIYQTNNEKFEFEIFDAFEIEDYLQYIETMESRTSIRNGIIDASIRELSNLGVNLDRNLVYLQLRYLTVDQKSKLKEFLRNLEYDQSVNVDPIKALGQKSILKGQQLAVYVSKIPESYRAVIIEAKRLSNA